MAKGIIDNIGDIISEVAEDAVGLDLDGDGDSGNIRSGIGKTVRSVRKALFGGQAEAKANYESVKRSATSKRQSDLNNAGAKQYKMNDWLAHQFGKVEAKITTAYKMQRATASSLMTLAGRIDAFDRYSALAPSGRGMFEDLQRGAVFVGKGRIDIVALVAAWTLVRSSSGIVSPVNSSSSLSLTNFLAPEGSKDFHSTFSPIAPKENAVLDARDVLFTIFTGTGGTVVKMLPGLWVPASAGDINANGFVFTAATLRKVTTDYKAPADFAPIDEVTAPDANHSRVHYYVGTRSVIKSGWDTDTLVDALVFAGVLLTKKDFVALVPVLQPLLGRLRGKNDGLFKAYTNLTAKGED